MNNSCAFLNNLSNLTNSKFSFTIFFYFSSHTCTFLFSVYIYFVQITLLYQKYMFSSFIEKLCSFYPIFTTFKFTWKYLKNTAHSQRATIIMYQRNVKNMSTSLWFYLFTPKENSFSVFMCAAALMRIIC